MKIEIKYFGMIAEVTRRSSEVLELSDMPISGVKEHLFAKYPELQKKNFRIAQDQELVSEETLLTGKEIALLPPFAGGRFVILNYKNCQNDINIKKWSIKSYL